MGYVPVTNWGPAYLYWVQEANIQGHSSPDFLEVWGVRLATETRSNLRKTQHVVSGQSQYFAEGMNVYFVMTH